MTDHQTTEPETADEDLDTTQAEPDSFPRSYVEELRAEAADHRTNARDNGARADLLAERLLAQTVATVAHDALADPSDLLDLVDHAELVDAETGLPDPDLIERAAVQLLDRKPHLARRRPTGQVDQGARSTEAATIDLAHILRSAAT